MYSRVGIMRAHTDACTYALYTYVLVVHIAIAEIRDRLYVAYESVKLAFSRAPALVLFFSSPNTSTIGTVRTYYLAL